MYFLKVLTHFLTFSLSRLLWICFFCFPVWGYATLSVTILSLVGLLSVAIIPIMQKVFYNHLLQFLVALAVGSLTGDALLHLIPHVSATVSICLGQHSILNQIWRACKYSCHSYYCTVEESSLWMWISSTDIPNLDSWSMLTLFRLMPTTWPPVANLPFAVLFKLWFALCGQTFTIERIT